MLSGHIMKTCGEQGLPPGTVTCELTGTAGQSFGAWLCRGVELHLAGFANDYVGKGMFGGVIAIKAPAGMGSTASGLTADLQRSVLAGNTALYGAIAGEVYIAGTAGERFCVRNSGTTAVAEGTGDHACEYMTGGFAVILGPVGRNFAAGMSGGIAYVFDPEENFAEHFNAEFADIEDLTVKDVARLRMILERHVQLTGSRKGSNILKDFDGKLASFRKIMPRDYRAYLVKKGEL
jgi:glutamate synthase domain-containing protein 3